MFCGVKDSRSHDVGTSAGACAFACVRVCARVTSVALQSGGTAAVTPAPRYNVRRSESSVRLYALVIHVSCVNTPRQRKIQRHRMCPLLARMLLQDHQFNCGVDIVMIHFNG